MGQAILQRKTKNHDSCVSTRKKALHIGVQANVPKMVDQSDNKN